MDGRLVVKKCVGQRVLKNNDNSEGVIVRRHGRHIWVKWDSNKKITRVYHGCVKLKEYWFVR